MNFNSTFFVTSANKLSQLPTDSLGEIAFAGRSNAGKSSALNAITGVKGLAKTSKTPGRTQLINFFQIAEHKYLVDLPGYGYAKVSRTVQAHWEKTLTQYIETRQELRGIVLIMDIRHPLKETDQQMIAWVTAQQLPVHILLSKADKLARGAANSALLQTQKDLAGYETLITVQLFSSLKKQGIDAARIKLAEWLQ